MLRQKLTALVDGIVGKTLTDVNVACEMIMLDFEGIRIHSQCLTRIVSGEGILLTTMDYQCWDGRRAENNDEWYNLARFRSQIVNNSVLKAELSDTNDLLISLTGDVQVQIYISNGIPHYGEEMEQWRIFLGDSSEHPHMVVLSKTIEEHK